MQTISSYSIYLPILVLYRWNVFRWRFEFGWFNLPERHRNKNCILFKMAKILGLSYCALSILSLVPLISCLPGSDTSLESRQFLNSYDQQVFKLTFYGAPDSWLVSKNCEASVSANNGSNTIAHPYCHWNGGYRGQYAGGDGSYGNPLTAASLFTSNNSPIPQCGVWYSPFLQKWLIYEDDCPSCPGKPGGAHFDIWVGGNGGGAGKAYNNPGICQCEDFLTPGGNNGGA